MKQRVIDVSSYQGTVDWQRVKADGVKGAVLKVIRKDLNPDKQFENNWAGCQNAGVPIVGVYNYSYATTLTKAKSDAEKVVSILAGRKAKVWLDVEDSMLKNLGKTLIEIINTYKGVITAAGLDFGVYTGLSFYNSFIKPYASSVDCKFWIARYPSSKTLDVSVDPSADKQPAIYHTLEGWQYSSKGQVDGISGNVDLNEWYGEIMTLDETVSTDCPYDVPERILKYKKTSLMRGNDVKWVQWHLARLGFLEQDDIDGIFGKATDAAVREAQEHYGILVDGIVGTDTRYVLRFN